jgi:hypothetical protein
MKRPLEAEKGIFAASLTGASNINKRSAVHQHRARPAHPDSRIAMAEADPTALPTPIPTSLNVTALAKRFGVARSTIQRRLKRGWTPPARVQRKARIVATPAAPRAAAAPALRDAAGAADRIVTLAALTAALALATCSAGFSIYGLTAIFAGAFWAGVGMSAGCIRMKGVRSLAELFLGRTQPT